MKVAVRCGVVVGLGSFLWLLCEYWFGFRTTNFGQHIVTSPFSVIVLIAGIAAAIYLTRMRAGSSYQFVDGFKTGMVVAAVAGVLMLVGSYVYYGLIDREFQQRAHDWAAYVEVKSGTSLEQATADADKGAWKHNMHVRAWSQVPLFLVEGAVVSTVTSAVMTRKKR